MEISREKVSTLNLPTLISLLAPTFASVALILDADCYPEIDSSTRHRIIPEYLV